MDLNIIWLFLIATLFVGFFILEGFDYGVGILALLVGKNNKEKGDIIKTIGPIWDTNQVWLITAGGAMFAAFRDWYATMFSSYYLALVLMIFALIARGMGVEYRKKLTEKNLHYAYLAIFVGSFLNALLWGVILGNTFTGIPINEKFAYAGGFFNLLMPHALVGGLLAVCFFIAHGSLYLTLKAPCEMIQTFKNYAIRFTVLAFVIALIFTGLIYFLAADHLNNSLLIYILIALALILFPIVWNLAKAEKYLLAFISNSFIVVLTVLIIVLSLFPNVMLSSLDLRNNLTIYNASGSQLTLRLMLYVVMVFLPIVLAYKIWTYYIFRDRIKNDSKDFYM